MRAPVSEGGRSLLRDLATDGGKSSPLALYFAATPIWEGWGVAEWASFFALVYTLILLSEKAWKLGKWASRKLAAKRAGAGP